MAYGSPSRTEDVMEYLEGIYEGRTVPQYAIDENTRKYTMFGGKSPSNSIISSIAEKLSTLMSGEGPYRVFLGNKHWKPTLGEAVEGIKNYGADRIVAIPLFPFPSENVVNSYSKPLIESMDMMGVKAELKVINGLNTLDLFIESWIEVLSPYVKNFSPGTLYLFSAHSLPTMGNPEEDYMKNFFKTSRRIAEKLGLENFAPAFQSRGKYGSSWLEPSVVDVLEENLGQGWNRLVAIPIGFIYDHLEILYDLDFEFGSTVKDSGIEYFRSGLPNDSDTFVRCLWSAVMNETSRDK